MASKRNLEASSSSSLTPMWNHDVFLSFRGDTRTKFTDHLYTALVQHGIRTFRDDDGLERGEDIASKLLVAIEQSKIAIIVFSKDYASSRWCLDELVKILECKKTMNQKLLPVFYDVDPSDVRKQDGSFAEAFKRHEERFKEEMQRVKKWRAGLTEAGNLSGYEFKFIQKIIQDVDSKLNQTPLNVAKYPIGIDSHVEDINLLLNVRLDDIRTVGIYGMSGIGKTTIAKAVYNLIFRKFDGSSFLANVGENSKNQSDQVRLQEQLLSDVLKGKKVEISNIDRGINVIKERLCSKSVLVVLDDVDDVDQLNALVGMGDWFGLGSRIIITTKDVHLLNVLKVDARYMVKELNDYESLQLFSWNAFGQHHPIEGYQELSIAIAAYAGGLPLVLEVLGSFLYKESILDWISALKKLQRIPHNRIQEKLRISYDALDPTEKALFLDIACFFIEMDKDDASRILDACDYYPNIGISILVRRSLVRIDENQLWMHNMIRDMGREIVRQESPNDPGERSRLWVHEEVLNVLKNDTGTKAVQGLILNFPRLEGVTLGIEAFENMKNLKLLQVNYLQLTTSYGDLLKEHFPFLAKTCVFRNLRWLCWHGFNLNYIPTNFHLGNLVILDMQDSSLKQVWRGNKSLTKLKVLNLSNSRCLTRTPNFLELRSLETLMLKGCTSLTEVDQSIGFLDKLIFLNLKDCKNLCNLPSSICDLKSLTRIILSGCPKLDNLPEEIGKLESLTELLADGTAIKQLPSSINDLKNLEELSLSGCKRPLSKSMIAFLLWSIRSPNSITLLPKSFLGLYSLKRLILRDCNLSERMIPSDIGSLSSLQELDLRINNFCTLPSSFSGLSRLMFLNLGNCTKLQFLPELPSSILGLYASNCTSMERLPNLSHIKNLMVADFSACNKLIGIQGSHGFESMPSIQMEIKNIFQRMLEVSSEKEGNKGTFEGLDLSICLPGSEIPDWFNHQTTGCSMSFELCPIALPEEKKLCPSERHKKIPKVILCFAYAAHESKVDLTEATVLFVCKSPEGLIHELEETIRIDVGSGQDHMWVRFFDIRSCTNFEVFEYGCEVDFTITGEALHVKKCGVHVLDESIELDFNPNELASEIEEANRKEWSRGFTMTHKNGYRYEYGTARCSPVIPFPSILPMFSNYSDDDDDDDDDDEVFISDFWS